MAENPVLKIRLAPEARARWEEAAARDGYSSLSEFVRAAAERAASGDLAGLVTQPAPSASRPVAKGASLADPKVKAVPARPKPAASTGAARGDRTSMCVHRLRPEQFCKTCDTK